MARSARPSAADSGVTGPAATGRLTHRAINGEHTHSRMNGRANGKRSGAIAATSTAVAAPRITAPRIRRYAPPALRSRPALTRAAVTHSRSFRRVKASRWSVRATASPIDQAWWARNTTLRQNCAPPRATLLASARR